MTDQPKPTPGPWQIVERGNDLAITADARIGMVDIATIEEGGFDEPFASEQRANATLIARAPELQQRVEELSRDNQRLRELLRECLPYTQFGNSFQTEVERQTQRDLFFKIRKELQ